MRTVLVTGASSGIGLASAVAAAQAGLTAVATIRRPGSDVALREAAEKAGVSVEVARLDVTDATSVDECVRSVIDRHGRLDAVVNNAGVLTSGTLELTTMASLRAGMEVNFFGVVAVSRAAMPHLRATRGRLITIGSVRGVIGQPFNEGYSAAKFAVEGYMEALAPVAAEVGVTVSLIEPAAVLDTEFVTSSGLDPATVLAAAGPYTDAFRGYRAWVESGSIEGAQTSAEVAEVVVKALTDPRPAFRIPTSEYGHRYLAGKLSDPAGGVIQELTRSWLH